MLNLKDIVIKTMLNGFVIYDRVSKDNQFKFEKVEDKHEKNPEFL